MEVARGAVIPQDFKVIDAIKSTFFKILGC